MFFTGLDHIHWTTGTAQLIISHWYHQLNSFHRGIFSPTRPSTVSTPKQTDKSFQNVHNLSTTFEQTPTHYSLLQRGLSFIPALNILPRLKMEHIQSLSAYHRRIQLWAFFGDSSSHTKFTSGSDWRPPLDRIPPEIGVLIKKDLAYCAKHFRHLRKRPNLTPREVIALHQLEENQEIVIKPADKAVRWLLWTGIVTLRKLTDSSIMLNITRNWTNPYS